MHVLANWIVQFLYCSIIHHADCNSGPFCTFKWTFLCILVDLFVQSSGLFVHSSGPFGGPFSDWEGSSEPREPPLATALQHHSWLAYFINSLSKFTNLKSGVYWNATSDRVNTVCISWHRLMMVRTIKTIPTSAVRVYVLYVTSHLG